MTWRQRKKGGGPHGVTSWGACGRPIRPMCKRANPGFEKGIHLKGWRSAQILRYPGIKQSIMSWLAVSHYGSTPVWFSVNPLLRPPSSWLLKTMGAQRQLLLEDSLSFRAIKKDDICNCFIAHNNGWLLLLGCSAWWKNKGIVWMFKTRLRQPLSTQKHGEGGSGGELNTQDEGEGCGWRKGRRRWLLHHLQG